MTGHDVILKPADGSLEIFAPEPGWRRQVPLKRIVQGPNRIGLTFVLGFAAVFTIWGVFVPLAGGAMAPGVLAPDQGKKVVQHLEDGIIAELRVHDGDVVEAGQPLVVLEDVQTRANHDALQQQLWSLLAKQARLQAETAHLDKIEWPAELQLNNAKIAAVIDAQRLVFETRSTELVTKKNILRQRIDQLNDQIRGLEAQVESASGQLELINEELQGKETLLKQGLMPKPEYLRLKRTKVEIEGRHGEYLAQIAKARQQIGEAQMQILNTDAERATQIATESDTVRIDLANTMEKLRSSEDVLKRTVVTAPISGTIVNSSFKTIGGVVEKGRPILEIVPVSDALIIEAHVTPIDVKAVHEGLRAQIHFTAYSSRSTPRIPGIVQSVSADRLFDDKTHQPYYLVKVNVDREAMRRLAPNVKLIPGMPADVLIITEHRTMFDYLFQPFLEVFRRSFHEV
ncbi:MAG TPA: HlyD family type I secretion periplasmic adaptor subunit [Pseudolabrys sp.]|nr:HlyD family type I secretion periplasmic adaptor subunit [Pseudolabrys sp.]